MNLFGNVNSRDINLNDISIVSRIIQRIEFNWKTYWTEFDDNCHDSLNAPIAYVQCIYVYIPM